MTTKDPKPFRGSKPIKPSEYIQSGEILESNTNYNSYGEIDVTELVKNYGTNIEIEYEISGPYGETEIDINILSKEKIVNPNYAQLMKVYEQRLAEYNNYDSLLKEWSKREKARKEAEDKATYEKLKKRFEGE